MSLIRLTQRTDYLRETCKGKSVLHLGCTDWPYTSQRLRYGDLLHLDLQQYARSLWGIDGDQEGLDLLAGRGVCNLFSGDLEHLEDVPITQTFDVVIAGEVIEHLSNPGLFLRGVRRFMEPNTVLVITTVNAYCGFRMLRYFARGRGGTAEPVHPDHVAYYSYATLTRLLTREQLAVRRFLFYDLGREHRPHHPWYLNWFNDVCVRVAKQVADGLIVECTLTDNGEIKK
jgi:SAM-dependent methyltransferase